MYKMHHHASSVNSVLHKNGNLASEIDAAGDGPDGSLRQFERRGTMGRDPFVSASASNDPRLNGDFVVL